ncbi:hypothetical protein LINPERHAP2_LOCUS3533 [Linum perenne]
MATASTFQANVALFLFIFCSSKLVPLFASSTLTTTTTSDSAIPVASPAVGRGDPSNISSFFPSPSGDQWPSPAAAAAAPTLSSSGEFTGKKSSSSTRLLVKLDPALNSILLLVLVPLCISFFLF